MAGGATSCWLRRWSRLSSCCRIRFDLSMACILASGCPQGSTGLAHAKEGLPKRDAMLASGTASLSGLRLTGMLTVPGGKVRG